MQVAVYSDLPFLAQLPHHLPQVENDWEVLLHAGELVVLPVKVTARQRAPVVAGNNSVGVKHWDYLEHEYAAQQVCVRTLRVRQEVYDSLHHKAGVCLPCREQNNISSIRGGVVSTWMDSSGYNDCSFRSHLCGGGGGVGYGEQVHHVPRQRGAEQLLSANLGPERALVQSLEKGLQVRVGVGVAVGEVAGVLSVWKLAAPVEAVVVPLLVGPVRQPVLKVVLVVEHILAMGEPAYKQVTSYKIIMSFQELCTYLAAVCALIRVEEGPHALAVEGGGLDEVHNNESVPDSRLHVPHLEEEPLGVFPGVQVVLQVQLVLELSHLVSFPEVPALEASLEFQRVLSNGEQTTGDILT